QAIVDCLKREGVDHVFGIPGTMNLPVLDALRATPEIRFVLTRHEQGAAFMAYGYARSLHRPAIVTATEGPGATNLVTGIGAAYKGYVPVISISGAQALFVREKDASQDIDQVTLHRSITKWAYSIPSVGKIQEAVRRAFRIALAEPLGPVHIDVSRDILLQQTEPEVMLPAAYRPSSRPACSPNDLDRAAALIAAVHPARGRRCAARERARVPAAPRGVDRNPGRDAAVPPGRISDEPCAVARAPRPQRLLEREQGDAAGRRRRRRGRAPRHLLHHV